MENEYVSLRWEGGGKGWWNPLKPEWKARTWYVLESIIYPIPPRKVQVPWLLVSPQESLWMKSSASQILVLLNLAHKTQEPSLWSLTQWTQQIHFCLWFQDWFPVYTWGRTVVPSRRLGKRSHMRQKSIMTILLPPGKSQAVDYHR